jgi:hypothetical protein
MQMMLLSAITFFICELLCKKNHGTHTSLFCLFKVILYVTGHPNCGANLH